MGDIKIECKREDGIGGNNWYVDITDGCHSVQIASGESASGAKRNAMLNLMIFKEITKDEIK